MYYDSARISYLYDVSGLHTAKTLEDENSITEYQYIWAKDVPAGIQVTTPAGNTKALRFLYESGCPVDFVTDEATPISM